MEQRTLWPAAPSTSCACPLAGRPHPAELGRGAVAAAGPTLWPACGVAEPTPPRNTRACSRALPRSLRRCRRLGTAASTRAGPATSAQPSAAATRCPGRRQGPAGRTRHCSRRGRAVPARTMAHRRPVGLEATMGDPGCPVTASMSTRGRGGVETTQIVRARCLLCSSCLVGCITCILNELLGNRDA